MAHSVRDATWRASMMPVTGEPDARPIPPRSHWITHWLLAIVWIQFLVPIVCLILDAISDSNTPAEVPWTTANPYSNLTIPFYYRGSAAAFWSNIIAVIIGAVGLITYHPVNTRELAREHHFRSTHAVLCKLAVLFCAISTFFAVWRWQVISKTVIKHGEASLKTPFALSIITCFLQVLPGSGSLFVPVLVALSITESKDNFGLLAPTCEYRERSPIRELFGMNKKAGPSIKERLFRSEPQKLQVCGVIEGGLQPTAAEEEQIPFIDPTVRKRKVSDLTDTASDVIRNLILDQMKRPIEPNSAGATNLE
ncbi:hypothetical protein BV898_04750 [Hypsibius exemplaris]|uniref:Uncharacterized protein n=1 Tax=Hypsibius exemplaris TaxID=2072580 RepID=A0A1W0X1C2_HYPEX|nr:hypothetical protein BV898_04750 [Hypsibius exemplaris]